MLVSKIFAYRYALSIWVFTFHFIHFQQEWELLVLYKLHWELSSITSLDYLDHALPRLCLNEDMFDMTDLRRRTETILVLAATDYQFTYHYPSLLAASAIMTALQSYNVFNCTSSNATSDVIGDKQDEQAKVNLSREIKLRLQTATHTAMVSTHFEYIAEWPFSNYRTQAKNHSVYLYLSLDLDFRRYSK